MRSKPSPLQYVKELQKKHPQAFRSQFLFYSAIQTKGILDELKELIPWVLSSLIFIPIFILLKYWIMTLGYAMQAAHLAGLGLMLLFMLYVPLILKQAKHSSHCFYQQQKHAPIRLTVLIMLQAVNMLYIDSLFMLYALLFFAISFAFVRFYKENLFREETTTQDYYILQQIRRACFWSYKKTVVAKWRYRIMKKGTPEAKLQKIKLHYYLALHLELYKYEHELCKKYKHTDIEKYLDSLM